MLGTWCHFVWSAPATGLTLAPVSGASSRRPCPPQPRALRQESQLDSGALGSLLAGARRMAGDPTHSGFLEFISFQRNLPHHRVLSYLLLN